MALVAMTLCASAAALPAQAAPGAQTAFTLTSAGAPSGVLSATYTCDGEGISLPLTWRGAPRGTKTLALVMDHVPPEGGHHWYLVEWGIPARARAQAAGTSNLGFFGGNSVNEAIGYAPPCSKGPGTKTYTVTLFALSAAPHLPRQSTASVNRDRLLSSIADITLDKAVLDVTYSR